MKGFSLGKEYNAAVDTLESFDSFLGGVEDSIKDSENFNELKDEVNDSFSKSNINNLTNAAEEDESEFLIKEITDMANSIYEENKREEEAHKPTSLARGLGKIASKIASFQSTIAALQTNPLDKIAEIAPGQSKGMVTMGLQMAQQMGFDPYSLNQQLAEPVASVIDGAKSLVFGISPKTALDLTKKGYADVYFNDISNAIEAKEVIEATNYTKFYNRVKAVLQKTFMKKVEVITKKPVLPSPEEVKQGKTDIIYKQEKVEQHVIDWKKVMPVVGILAAIGTTYVLVDKIITNIATGKSLKLKESISDDLYESLVLMDSFADKIKKLITAPFRFIKNMLLKLVKGLRKLNAKMLKALKTKHKFSVGVSLILFIPVIMFGLLLLFGKGLITLVLTF